MKCEAASRIYSCEQIDNESCMLMLSVFTDSGQNQLGGEGLVSLTLTGHSLSLRKARFKI